MAFEAVTLTIIKIVGYLIEFGLISYGVRRYVYAEKDIHRIEGLLWVIAALILTKY